jgi:hypothetical protein
MAPSQSNEVGLLAAYDAGSPMRVADLTRSGCRPGRTSPLCRPTVDAALWPTQTPSFGSVRLVLPGGVPAFVQVSTLDAGLAHQPLHPFPAYPDVVAGQHGADAWRAVCRRDCSQMASIRSAKAASGTARADGVLLTRL